MISRCPSCGFQVKEDERLCGSCGWDLVVRKRVPLPDKKPSAGAPPSKPADSPEKPGSFALPPARNLNESSPKPFAKAPPEPEPETESGPALMLPGQADEVEPADAAAPRRGSPVYIAAVAGAAIGTVSVLAVSLLLRQEAAPVQHPASGASPFAARNAPSEAAPPAPKDDMRPAASFTATPRVTMAASAIPEPAKPAVPKPAAAKKPARRAKSKGPAWVFEGVVFDLLTARGVFAAKLSFVDPDGNVVGETSTGGGGGYKAVLPVGGPHGYALKISHGDYTERYIDEGDATSSLREATPEERKILMHAGVRNLPWVGLPKKSVRRDLGLVPLTLEEP